MKSLTTLRCHWCFEDTKYKKDDGKEHKEDFKKFHCPNCNKDFLVDKILLK